MRLADDQTAICLGFETIHLRATLRAAFRLERTYEGFHNLSEAIALGHVAAFADLIREASDDPKAVDCYFEYVASNPMLVSIMELREPLLKFIPILSGAADAKGGDKTSSGPRITFEEYHTKLFRIATGWLGWTPEQAWNATLAEILEAHQGRTEMLASIFGGGKKGDNENLIDLTKGSSDASARARLNALGDTAVTSMSQVPPCQ
jgi:hypothetical protein